MLLQLALPDELVEPARSQTDLVGLLLLGGWRRIEELVTHGAIRAPSTRRAAPRRRPRGHVAHRVTDLVRSVSEVAERVTHRGHRARRRCRSPR